MDNGSIVEYFGSCLGETKIPLAYVVRKEMVPEQAPIGGWPSNKAEMIGHVPLVANVAAVPMVLAEHYKTNKRQFGMVLDVRMSTSKG
jgi:hypothetical protein